ncbi:PSMD5 [Mytilus edulis]|uniref:26S proteasome non-ATPase regulatory subunit 5 n=1 Tax=Mytilus edulis TaxID=6550 RepID=A0A8S3RWU5_MYTED|nr:PSMD5 [Mytilus edulis]
MAANVDDICRSLETTTLSTDVLSTLVELKAALSSVRTINLHTVVSVSSVQKLFGLLNTDDGEIIEECCSILKNVLLAWSPAVGLDLFKNDFDIGLKHPSTTIQCLCLRQLELAGEDDQTLLNWDSARDVIKTVISLIASPSLQVAKHAQNVILNISRTNDGVDFIYSSEMLSSLQEVLQTDDTVKFRVYELIVHISKVSESALQKTRESGLLQLLLNEIHKDDILSQLNCLELLSDLGMVEHGIVFLDGAGIIKQIETLLSTSSTDPMGGLLLPGLIKFFGGVAYFYPKEVFNGNKTFVNLLLRNLTSEDKNLCSISVQTIGLIAKTIEGKLALEKLGNMFIDGLQTIGKMVKQAPSDLREIALHTTANLIHIPVPEQTSDNCKLSEKWFDHLDPNMLQIIMSIARQPFPELRHSSHSVLSALALIPWGQKRLCEFPGFNEYLLDRSTEKSKEAKESKYEIVRTLAESPTSMDIFGSPYIVQLKAYFLQGPIYVQTESQVAFEGD